MNATLEIYQKPQQNWLRFRRITGKEMKIIEKFSENRMLWVEEFKVINI